MKQLKLIIAALFLISPFAANADQITIDFDSLVNSEGGFIRVAGDTYAEDGFTISAANLNYFAQNATSYAGSAGLHSRSQFALMVLTAGGATFGMSSIDLSILNPIGALSDVTFIGALLGGGTVSQTFSVSAFGFTTFDFNGSFSGLTALRWRQGTGPSNAHQFDNIVVNVPVPVPVPEPGTLALLGLGLAGMGIARRKKA